MAALDKTFLRKVFRQTLDVLYPPQCEMCRAPLAEGKHLCPSCSDQLPRIRDPFCNRCGEMFEGNICAAFTCANCSKLDYDFSFCRPVLASSIPANELIHGLKYRGALHISSDLARIAGEAFDDPRLQQARQEGWTLIPTPLHWLREQHRRYNQSREIVVHMANQLGLPWCDALKRTRFTSTQTALSRSQRLKNLKGCFTLSRSGHKWLANRPNGAILFDDVFTTGATAQECSATLRRAGIENRVVVTLMRG